MRTRIAATLAVLAALAVAPASAAAAELVVNSNNDVTDAQLCDATHCSLREAITRANQDSAADAIRFAIGTAGTSTSIAPTSALPGISQPVTIDGLSQGGTSYTGAPLVELNGASAGNANGLVVTGPNVVIKGLVVNRWQNDGIVLLGAFGSAAVLGSYIGTNAAGTAASPNGGFGVRVVGGATATIGAPTSGGINVISGNSAGGIQVDRESLIGPSVQINGNAVGTNLNVNAAIPNGGAGIDIVRGSVSVGGASAPNAVGGNGLDGIRVRPAASVVTIRNNLIGTDSVSTVVPNAGAGVNVENHLTTVGPGNVISANLGDGVDVSGDSNTVKGNYIGTNAVGTAKIGAQPTGVRVTGIANTVGGTAAGDGNTIGGNPTAGVRLDAAATTTVAGNFIGTNAGGNPNVENGNGIHVTNPRSNNLIGGAGAARNVISGNTNNGVIVQASSPDSDYVRLLGNYIGTTPAGTAALPNGDTGVTVSGGRAVVGTPGEPPNVISGNAGRGVYVSGSRSRVRNNIIGSDKDGMTDLGNGQDGVFVTGDDNHVTGNQIAGNGGAGVVANNAAIALPSRVQGNRIGTNAAGSAAIANAGGGVLAGAGRAWIGGTGAGEGNQISGNTGDGVALTAGNGHIVRANRIGLNDAATAALPNGDDGVAISGGSGHNVGSEGAANVISGNAGDGVQTAVSSNVRSNIIGLGGNGNTDVGNAGDGVRITAGGQTVLDNVISGNQLSGLSTAGSSTATIWRNWIGTDATGTLDRGNALDGIYAGGGNFLSIGDPGDGNLISGNNRDGVRLYTTSALLRANRIGAREGSDNAIPNGATGVRVKNGGNTIGGDAAGYDNLIVGNGAQGVLVESGTGTRITRNRIYGNVAQGIDLAGDGLTANDAGDADSGPNGRQNFPLVAAAVAGGDGLAVAGTLQSAPSRTYTVELFSTPSCRSSGHGDAMRHIGSLEVTTGADGNASFSAVLDSGALTATDSVTATATAPDGSTSEFSACRTVVPGPQGSIGDATATEGGAATFTVTLASAAAAPVEVTYRTVNGSAVAGADFTGEDDGRLTFPAGQTTRTITVPVTDDSADEGAETFEVELTDGRGVGGFADDTGRATIAASDRRLPAPRPAPGPGGGGSPPAATVPLPPQQPAEPQPPAPADEDGDGLTAAAETALGTSNVDRDSDDDGLPDGKEDKNRNGRVDKRKETNPAKADTDRDRLPDGLERGVTKPVADPPGPVLGTNRKKFRPDRHRRSRTNPLKRDSDGDRKADGKEDRNRNGRVDRGESDPRKRRG